MLLIGTSGFSYKDWIGPVYPPGTPPKDYLGLYQREFNFTELNFSYYKMPDYRTLDRMVHITNDNFMFSIKSHKSVTHEISMSLYDNIKEFRDGIAPLIESAKLAAILIQFPFSFHYTAESRKHLLAVCKAFEGLPAAVEFRNDAWQRESVYKGFEDYGITLVNVDEPDLPGLPKPTAIVTAHTAYLRFHGRNSAQWWTGDNASRYDYCYTEAELSEWIPKIQVMVEKAAKVIIAFNNHWKGQAVTNAKMIKNILEVKGLKFGMSF
jgi:uncharacterized protein YecE (DUF72 family)